MAVCLIKLTKYLLQSIHFLVTLLKYVEFDSDFNITKILLHNNNNNYNKIYWKRQLYVSLYIHYIHRIAI